MIGYVQFNIENNAAKTQIHLLRIRNKLDARWNYQDS